MKAFRGNREARNRGWIDLTIRLGGWRLRVRPWPSPRIWMILAILCLPIGYVLSIGPIMRVLFASGGYAHPVVVDAFNFYANPCHLLAEVCPPYQEFINWYIRLWVPVE